MARRDRLGIERAVTPNEDDAMRVLCGTGNRFWRRTLCIMCLMERVGPTGFEAGR